MFFFRKSGPSGPCRGSRVSRVFRMMRDAPVRGRHVQVWRGGACLCGYCLGATLCAVLHHRMMSPCTVRLAFLPSRLVPHAGLLSSSVSEWRVQAIRLAASVNVCLRRSSSCPCALVLRSCFGGRRLSALPRACVPWPMLSCPARNRRTSDDVCVGKATLMLSPWAPQQCLPRGMLAL